MDHGGIARYHYLYLSRSNQRDHPLPSPKRRRSRVILWFFDSSIGRGLLFACCDSVHYLARLWAYVLRVTRENPIWWCGKGRRSSWRTSRVEITVRACIARNLRDHSCTLRKLFVSLVSYSPLQHVLFFLRKYLIFAEEFLFNSIFLLYLFIYFLFIKVSIVWKLKTKGREDDTLKGVSFFFSFLFFFPFRVELSPHLRGTMCIIIARDCTWRIGARMGMRILLRYHAVVIPRGRQECDFWPRGWTAPSSYAWFARDVWTPRVFAGFFPSFFFITTHRNTRSPSCEIIHCEKSRITAITPSLLSSTKKNIASCFAIATNRDTSIDSRFEENTWEDERSLPSFFLLKSQTNTNRTISCCRKTRETRLLLVSVA